MQPVTNCNMSVWITTSFLGLNEKLWCICFKDGENALLIQLCVKKFIHFKRFINETYIHFMVNTIFTMKFRNLESIHLISWISLGGKSSQVLLLAISYRQFFQQKFFLTDWTYIIFLYILLSDSSVFLTRLRTWRDFWAPPVIRGCSFGHMKPL